MKTGEEMERDGREAGPPMPGAGAGPPSAPRPQVTPRTVVVVLATTLVFLGALYLLWELRQIAQWGIIAAFLAVALQPAVAWLGRRRVPRGPAVLLVYAALLLALVGLGALVAPPLVDQVRGLADAVAALVRQPGGAGQALEDLATRYGMGDYVDELRAQLEALPSRLGAAAGPLLAVTRGVVGSVTATLSVLLMAFFLLLDGERFVAAGLTLVDPVHRPRLRRLLGQAARAIHGYITGNLAISLIAGVAAYLALRLLGMPYALALALVVAVFDLIPLVGATLGAAAVILVALAVDPVKGGILALFFVLYQQLENNVLQPLVYGRSVRLHPLAVFVAVLAGAELLGILGALLAIPVAEILRLAAAEWLASRAQAAGAAPPGPPGRTPIDDVAADTPGPADGAAAPD